MQYSVIRKQKKSGVGRTVRVAAPRTCVDRSRRLKKARARIDGRQSDALGGDVRNASSRDRRHAASRRPIEEESEERAPNILDHEFSPVAMETETPGGTRSPTSPSPPPSSSPALIISEEDACSVAVAAVDDDDDDGSTARRRSHKSSSTSFVVIHDLRTSGDTRCKPGTSIETVKTIPRSSPSQSPVASLPMTSVNRAG